MQREIIRTPNVSAFYASTDEMKLEDWVHSKDDDDMRYTLSEQVRC